MGSTKTRFILNNTQKQFSQEGKLSVPHYQKYILGVIKSLQELSGTNPNSGRCKKEECKKFTCQNFCYLSIILLSVLWLTTVILRILFFYGYMPFSFILVLMADIIIGCSPLGLLLIYSMFFDRKKSASLSKKGKSKPNYKLFGLEENYAQIYDSYLEKSYLQITQALKPGNIIFRWKFRRNIDKTPPIIEYINGKKIVIEKLTWTLGKIIFIENPSDTDKLKMSKKMSQSQQRAERKLSEEDRMFETSRNTNLEPTSLISKDQGFEMANGLFIHSSPQPIIGVEKQIAPRNHTYCPYYMQDENIVTSIFSQPKNQKKNTHYTIKL